MAGPNSPKRAANDLSLLLKAVLGEDRFPVDVEALALEVSKSQPDPITEIKRVEIPGFEGMLRAKRKSPGWQIICNAQERYPGRERFTLAHELGHYQLHRRRLDENDYSGGRLPDGFDFECLPLQSNVWRDVERDREEEADTFASYLLMPIDDYREQVAGRKICKGLLKHITNRYGVSLLAAVRKWIEFTETRAAMIVARDGYALWGRASSAALASGIFVRSGMQIPDNAIASIGPDALPVDQEKAVRVPAGVWRFSRGTEDATDLTIFSERLGISVTVLQFDGQGSGADYAEGETRDTYDQFVSNSR